MNGVTMSTFTIDTDNNITAYAATPDNTNHAEAFSTEKELARITAEWPASRLVDTWNSFAGIAPFDDLKPVKKFTDRKAAVARIWKAVQRLTPSDAPQEARVATNKVRAKKSPAKVARRATAAKEAKVPRQGSKTAEVVELLRRKQGATLAEIMKATGWQPHSVRGFISGTITKKLGLTVESSRSESKERTYRITA